ncbi:hypothetical protein Tco_0671825 [Tanacetum coccineum]
MLAIPHLSQVSSMAEIDSKEAQMKLKAGICLRFTTHNKHTWFLLSPKKHKPQVQEKKTSAINRAFCKPLRHSLSPKSTSFNEFSSNIATALVCLATNRTYNFSKMIFDGHDEENETTFPIGNVEHGEAFSTVSSLDAGQDRENIPKTSAMPHESSPRVTSLGGEEGSMQQQLKELMDFCTNLQSQHTTMVEKIKGQDLEISQLKARVKTLEEQEMNRAGVVQEDAPNRGGIDQGEADVFKGDAEKDSSRSTDKGSESIGEFANVLSFMGAVIHFHYASEQDPTTEAITTARVITPYTRRPRASRGVIIRSTSPIPMSVPSARKEDKKKGKEIMTESEKPTKAKVQEQISLQLARELQEEFVHEDQSIREQIKRDAEIARIHVEEDLRQMIDELDRSNEMINKHMAEYEEAKNELSIKEKTELIT